MAKKYWKLRKKTKTFFNVLFGRVGNCCFPIKEGSTQQNTEKSSPANHEIISTSDKAIAGDSRNKKNYPTPHALWINWNKQIYFFCLFSVSNINPENISIYILDAKSGFLIRRVTSRILRIVDNLGILKNGEIFPKYKKDWKLFIFKISKK